MIKIGPTFGDECRAAGLGGLRFSWGDDGDIQGRENLTPDQNAALDAVLAAHTPDRPAVPQTVTPRQARLALLGAGLLPLVEAAVKAAGGATQITWEYASEINRHEPLIETLGSALGLTDAQIDALFRTASTL